MGLAHLGLLNFAPVPIVSLSSTITARISTMILRLRCGKEHQFQAWFKDGQTCERQLARKTVECPTGSRKVAKALMAPRIGGSEKKQQSADLPAKAPAPETNHPMSVMASAMRQHLQEVRSKVEANCD